MKLSHLLVVLTTLVLIIKQIDFYLLNRKINKLEESILLMRDYLTNVDVGENEITSYEEMKEERERLFNERILNMKEELANLQDGSTIYTPQTTAEILHPDVYNLPEDTPLPTNKYEEEISE